MNHDALLAGGYFLTRPVERDDEFMAVDLLPERIVTLSSCLSDVALEYWWNEENVAEAAGFGVPERLLPKLVTWYLEQFDTRLGAPGVGFSTAAIREFLERFVPDPTDLVILGGGVRQHDAARLVDGYRVPPDQGEYGVGVRDARARSRIGEGRGTARLRDPLLRVRPRALLVM